MNPDLLARLRDIHVTPDLGWWPPAPGWWLLALLLLALLAWFGLRLLAHYRARQRRKQMLAWIDHLNATVDPQTDPQTYLSTVNRIFKLVALRAFPGQQCAAMAGPQWEAFVRSRMKNPQSAEPLKVLASGPYSPAPGFDPDIISALTCQWIRRYG